MHQPKKRQLYILLNVIIIVSAIVVVTFLVRSYTADIQSQAMQETIQLHDQIASQNAVLIKEKLKSDENALTNMAAYIANEYDDLNQINNLDMLRSQTTTSPFNMIVLTTLSEESISTSGIDYELYDESFFKDVLGGKTIISDPMKFSDIQGETILISVPIFKNSEVIGMMSGRYQLSKLQSLLTMETFEGKGYDYIAKKYGKVIIHSDHKNADPNFLDINTNFSDSTFFNGTSKEQLLEGMRKGEQGEVSYKWNGMERSMNYVPININDWYLLSVVPTNVLSSRATELLQQTMIIVTVILLVIVLILFLLWQSWRRTQRAVHFANRQLNVIYQNIRCGIYRCSDDNDFTVIIANEGFYRFIGYTKEEFASEKQNQLSKIMVPSDFDRIWKNNAQHDHDTQADEYRIITKNGEVRWVLFSSMISYDKHGNRVWDSTFTDITQLKSVQNELSQTQHRYDLIMSQVKDVIFEWNCSTHSLFVSQYFVEKFGYEAPSGEFPQNMIDAKCVHEDDIKTFLAIFTNLSKEHDFAKGDVRIRCHVHQYRWFRINATFIQDLDQQPCIIGLISDIHEQKQETATIKEIAKHDPLTSLLNRSAIETSINDYLTEPNGRGAFLILDVDNFKGINDQYGHAQGDKVLTGAARLMKQICRSSDVVGRFGGDEFIIFLKDISQDYQIELKAEELIAGFQSVLQKTDVSCSIGIAQYPEDGTVYADLFDKADKALYHAKSHGKNKYIVYGKHQR